jgi:hypothetical protein
MWKRFHVKYPSFSFILMELDLSRQILEKTWSIIRPVGAELFHAERRKDGQMEGHDKANSRFSNFANAPKKDTRLQACILTLVLNNERNYVAQGRMSRTPRRRSPVGQGAAKRTEYWTLWVLSYRVSFLYRKQYSGPLLWNLGITFPVTIEGPIFESQGWGSATDYVFY